MIRRVLGLVAAACFLLLLGPAGAAHANGAERITAYDVVLDIRPDGELAVTENITYDFGANRRHGIVRQIPVRFDYDDTHQRTYPLSGVTVTADGRPAQVSSGEEGSYRVLKVGDPDREITGVHRYTLRYTVRGALNRFDDHVELYWNAIGAEWTVPIAAARAEVRGPADFGRVTCYAGPQGSRLPCDSASSAGGTARFAQARLGPGEGLTTVVELPAGSVTGTDPVLTERRDATAAFRATPLSLGGMAGASLLGIGGALAVLWGRGRDRRYAGQIPGLVPAPGQLEVERRMPLRGAGPVAVEFAPPDGLRPGQVGTLVDEKAQVVDVTATIVDFAVRGHLRIVELAAGGYGGGQDWELVKLNGGDPGFHGYERSLFDALFAGRDRVKLSDLKNTFADRLSDTQKRLYDDVVAQGWYRRSPEATRNLGWGLGVVLVLAAGGVTFLLATFTHVALVGLGLVAGALVFLVCAGRLPSRTGRGSAMLARVLGFRQYLSVAEGNQIRFEEREQIFSRYLPYAMVFGIAERWAHEFADLAVQRGDGSAGLYWYTGQPGWSLLYFPQSIGAFATTTAGTIASTPPSASGSSGFGGGGFSGGGGGGGGGGSW
jgi:uncharacterized membrane protein YgcG